MIKVIILKFQVSNATSSPCTGDSKERWFQERQQELFTQEDVEEVLNNTIQDKEIIDIKINTVDVHYHNNSRGNTVELWYTIMYKE